MARKPLLRGRVSTKPAASVSTKPGRFQLGFSLHQQGKLAEARAIYEETLRSQPNHFDALHLLGLILFDFGDLLQALRLIDRAIALNPKQAACYANRASLQVSLGKPEAALADFGRAIVLKPDFAEAYGNRGNLYTSLCKPEAALADFDRAIALKPDFADAYGNRGNLNLSLGKLDAAQADFDQAIALKPGFAKAYSNRGNLYLSLDMPEAAQADFDRAIALRPDLAEAYCSRGNLNLSLGRLEAAQADFDQAIALKPDLAEAYCNRGNLHLALGELEAAETDFDGAIAINPNSGQFNYNKALLVLSNGDFENGWSLYERRWDNPKFPESKRIFHKPRWLGDLPLQDKTILIASEQGLGDTIQFCRYASLVKMLGAKVILEVQEPLAGLLGQLPGVDQFVILGSPLPAFDVYCPLLSLPYAFRTRLDTIPTSQGYLHVAAETITEWGEILGHKTKPRVGIAWSGNPRHINDRYRSIPLAQFVSQLPSNCDYFSLQKEARNSDEIALLSCSGIRHFGDELGDFTDTAALCSLMDLIICVDTSVAHLSAALGLPTWILLSSNADWRWMRDRKDTPWYSSATLYRQMQRFDWSGVLDLVGTDLLLRFRELS